MLDANGYWYPTLSPKQIAVYNDPKQHILLSGPRMCGKTIVAVHKAIKHAWLYNNDRVGIFVKSTKVGKTGIWDDLLSYALPAWAGDGDPDDPNYDPGLKDDGFEIVQSGVDGATRMHYVKIRNCHGGVSEIQLHPLHHEDSVAEKLKGSRFGCIVFDEVDNYDNEEVFNVSTLQLRQIGLPEDKHQWIGTCNPAGDQEHWIYQKFWVDTQNPEMEKSYRDSFGLYEFKLSDNPFLQKKSLIKLQETYRNDPDMYKRYVEGMWVPDQRKIHFAAIYKDTKHRIGDVLNGETIVPTEGCTEIKVGWDLGETNTGIVFMEHVITGKGDYWAILDEVVHIKEEISMEAMTFEVMGKMEEIRKIAGNPKLAFKHWSDRSAFDRYRSAADAKDHILVNRYSGGDIELIGCPKPPHSVQARLALVRQLLVSDRLFVSDHCTSVISMFKRLSKGTTKAEQIKRCAQGHIHVFDGMSYALYGELIDEIEESMRPKTGARDWGITSVNA